MDCSVMDDLKCVWKVSPLPLENLVCLIQVHKMSSQ